MEEPREPGASVKEVIDTERLEALEQLEEWLEVPMMVLGLVWLVLFVWEVVWGIGPVLEIAGMIIWGLFILDFAIRFTLAPDKWRYLRSNWLTALSLALPAFRLVRVARLAYFLRLGRVARGMRLVRVVSSLNRGMRALRAGMGRRGFGYAIALTAAVTLVGAAGMFAFESDVAGGAGLNSYGSALWWTAMTMTTMGADYSPRTPEGRVLGLLLAVYAFAVFGYVTAALATYFIGQEASSPESDLPSAHSLEALRAEIQALRAEIHALSARSETGDDG